ncbi:MAG: FeoA family protein [Bacteroidales bacterium]|jgi:ferrous iron transport protein A|nr:FeoA family protein [Bacteroidales bacterium]
MLKQMHHRHGSGEGASGISLSDLEDGKTGIIVSVLGGKMLTKRLADLGITAGKEVKVIRKTLFSGPVQVEVAGSKLVIGWGLASKIMVEVR